jgi:hypothetical protein
LLDELVDPYEPNMFSVRRVVIGLDDVECLVKGSCGSEAVRAETDDVADDVVAQVVRWCTSRTRWDEGLLYPQDRGVDWG